MHVASGLNCKCFCSVRSLPADVTLRRHKARQGALSRAFDSLLGLAYTAACSAGHASLLPRDSCSSAALLCFLIAAGRVSRVA